MEKRPSPPGIADKINLVDSERLAKAGSTLKTYQRYITGKRGWLEWTEAQGLSPVGLDINATSHVAECYTFWTENLTLGEDLGGQLTAAILAYNDANTECGKGKWTTVKRTSEPAFSTGKPAFSSRVVTVKDNHRKARVRAGIAAPESLDVIAPIHIRAFFAASVRGRRLQECDPVAVMLHACSLLGMSMLLRFIELTGLHTDQLGQSTVGGTLHPTFSLESTKNCFQRKDYDLLPWPCSLSLDPRYASSFILFGHALPCVYPQTGLRGLL